LKNALLKPNAHALLISRVVGQKLLKEDKGAIKKLKTELAKATSPLNSALNTNMDLVHNNKELELENKAARGKPWS